jgi:intein-encoded DNA endonuclease-like protein
MDVATRRFGILDREQQRAQHEMAALEDEKIFAAVKAGNISVNDEVNKGAVNPVTTATGGLSPESLADAWAEVEQYDIPVTNVIVHAKQQRDLRLWTHRNFDPVRKCCGPIRRRVGEQRAISGNTPRGQFRGKTGGKRITGIRRDYTLSTQGKTLGDDIVRSAWQHAELAEMTSRLPEEGNSNNKSWTQREMLKTGLTANMPSINSTICKNLSPKSFVPKSKNLRNMRQLAGKNQYQCGYVVGVYYGDGSVAKDSKTGKKKTIQLSSIDLEFTEKFLVCLELLTGKTGRIKYEESNTAYGVAKTFRATVHSIEWATWLFGAYPKNQLPRMESREFARGFLEGLMDSEGYVSKNKPTPHCKYGTFESGISGKNEWIHLLAPLFEQFGIKSTPRKQWLHKKFWYYTLRFNLMSLAKSDLSFCIKRKIEKLEQYRQMVRSSTTVRRAHLDYDSIDVMTQSDLHGDMQSPMETVGPIMDSFVSSKQTP